MPATSAMISQVRKLVGDPTLTDSAVSQAIERYPLMDLHGKEPFVWGAGSPPSRTLNPAWDPTYDLHAATADLLEEKAALLAKDFDFATEQERFERSQKYTQTMSLVRHHRARRAPQTVSLVAWPPAGSGAAS